MTDLDYPAGDLDKPEALLATLGTFWSDVYGNQDMLRVLLRAKLEAARRGRDAAARLAACRSRFGVPVYRVERHWPVSLAADAEPASARYGADEDADYGDGTVLGVPASGPVEQVPGGGMLGAPLLTDSLFVPARVLVEGIDYRDRDDGAMLFLDRLSGPHVAWRARFDDRLPDKFVGSVAGLNLPTSARALDLALTVEDAAINGPSHANLARALARLAGFSVAAVGNETVDEVVADANGTLVVTDRAVYRVPPGAVPAVEVGQFLRGGESLSDAVRVVEAGGGAAALPADVDAVSVPPAYLDPSLSLPVVFGRDAEALVVATSGGKTRVSWAGAGPGGDAFFDLVHARGVAGDRTLADCLDRRPEPRDGEPTAASLPATVSPLDLLCRWAWVNRLVTLVLVKRELIADTLEVDWNSVLRLLVAPHAAALVVDL